MDPPVVRVPGTAVYLNARRETTPLALRAGVEHTGVVHEAVVIISIETTKAPYVPESERLVVDNLGYEDDGISHLTARFGFQDMPDVPRLLALAERDRPGVRDRRRRRRLLPLPGHDHRRPPRPAWPAGASASSWRCRATRPARSSTSACPGDRTGSVGSAIEL